MVSVESLVRCLREVGVGFFVGVPDSLLKSFCAYVTDNCGIRPWGPHGRPDGAWKAKRT